MIFYFGRAKKILVKLLQIKKLRWIKNRTEIQFKINILLRASDLNFGKVFMN